MKGKQRWLRFEEDDYILVIPETDILPHGFPKKGKKKTLLANADCPCKPKITFINGLPMIVHNSFEDIKRINKSLSTLTK